MTKKWTQAVQLLICSVLLSYPAVVFAASADHPKPVEVIGPVEVSNLPGTQAITGSVSVDNLPAVQQVSGNVTVTNPPADPLHVIIDGTNGPPVDVVGAVNVMNLPDVTLGDVAPNVEVPVWVVGGEVTVANLDKLTPTLVEGGADVINPHESSPEIIHVDSGIVLTDLVVYNAGAFRTCLVELGKQYPDGWISFFSFEPDQGLNQISLKSGIQTSAAHPLSVHVSNGAGACGASLLWTGHAVTP
jgi:hypothetical protein